MRVGAKEIAVEVVGRHCFEQKLDAHICTRLVQQPIAHAPIAEAQNPAGGGRQAFGPRQPPRLQFEAASHSPCSYEPWQRLRVCLQLPPVLDECACRSKYV